MSKQSYPSLLTIGNLFASEMVPEVGTWNLDTASLTVVIEMYHMPALDQQGLKDRILINQLFLFGWHECLKRVDTKRASLINN